MRSLLVAVLVSLQGCSAVDPDPHDGCPSPAAFQPTNVSGVWSGMIRDAIPVRFELVQLSPTISHRNPAELSGTVSITIGGEVETSGPVTGDTSARPCGRSREVSSQHIHLGAALSVKPDDNLDLALTLDFLGGPLQSDEVDGLLRYAGPTSVTFGPDGEVVGIELDAFSDNFFMLTRVQGQDQPSRQP